MRFYLDADLSPIIAEVARDLGVDVTSANPAGMRLATDAAQLAHAVAEERCMVTNNRNDFIDLSIAYFEAGLDHYGILITTELPAHDFGTVARALAAYAARYPDDPPPRNILDWLPPAEAW